MFFINLNDFTSTNSDANIIKNDTPKGIELRIEFESETFEVKHYTITNAIKNKKLFLKIESGKRPRAIDADKMASLLKPRISNRNNTLVTLTNTHKVKPVIRTTQMSNVVFDQNQFKLHLTNSYFDCYFSRKCGIPAATMVTVIGDAGIGKSANLMDILVKVKKANPDKKVLYVSAEMKPIDITEFLNFYPGLEDIDFYFIGEELHHPDNEYTAIELLEGVAQQGWDLIVLDSMMELQGMVQEAKRSMGEPSSKVGAESWLLDYMSNQTKGYNDTTVYTSFFVIQQVNKSGQFAGSNRIMHMTDAFLELRWCKQEPGKRYMMFTKNRKGMENVKLYYSFSPDGISYDQARHEAELNIRLRLNSGEPDDINEADSSDILSLLSSRSDDADIL